MKNKKIIIIISSIIVLILISVGLFFFLNNKTNNDDSNEFLINKINEVDNNNERDSGLEMYQKTFYTKREWDNLTNEETGNLTTKIYENLKNSSKSKHCDVNTSKEELKSVLSYFKELDYEASYSRYESLRCLPLKFDGKTYIDDIINIKQMMESISYQDKLKSFLGIKNREIQALYGGISGYTYLPYLVENKNSEIPVFTGKLDYINTERITKDSELSEFSQKYNIDTNENFIIIVKMMMDEEIYIDENKSTNQQQGLIAIFKENKKTFESTLVAYESEKQEYNTASFWISENLKAQE